jgi:hypothetical protein
MELVMFDRRANIYSAAFDTLITITIGPPGAEKDYHIYRRLLCSHSKYFDNMLNGGFKEASQDTPKVADIDVNAFQCFFYWLNTGVVHIDMADCPEKADTTIDEVDQTRFEYVWGNVIDAYIMADYLQAQRFKNALVDYLYLYTEAEGTLFSPSIKRLYENTMKGDLLRKLIVDISIQEHSSGQVEEDDPDLYAKEYLLDLIFAIKDKKNFGSSTDTKSFMRNMRACFCALYHGHSE